MAIAEVLIQVTDVSLGLWEQWRLGWPDSPQPPADWGRGAAPSAGHWPRGEDAGAWSTPLPHAGTYLCPPVLQQRPGETRRKKEKEDRTERGRKGQKITGFRDEREAWAV